MSAWLTLSEAAFAVTTLVCGVWLLRTRSATASGALLAATGIGVFGVIGCAANGATQAVDIGRGSRSAFCCRSRWPAIPVCKRA